VFDPESPRPPVTKIEVTSDGVHVNTKDHAVVIKLGHYK